VDFDIPEELVAYLTPPSVRHGQRSATASDPPRPGIRHALRAPAALGDRHARRVRHGPPT
jgi:hypothetical protein